MEEAPLVTDPHDAIPSSCGDILALAEKAVERYWHEPTILNLYPMTLLTSHAVDWYVTRDLKKPDGTKFVEQFRAAYPKWDVIRRVGNGLKHPKVELVSVDQFATEDMMWEHRDSWDGVAYGTLFEGRMVPVDCLCFDFVREFSEDLATGRVRETLPALHQEQSCG